MPIPPEIRNQLAKKAKIAASLALDAALDAAIKTVMDEVWDAASKATLSEAAAKVQHIFGAAPAGRDTPAPEPVNPFTGQHARTLWDHPKSAELMSPQKRGAQNREAKGVVKGAIREIIYDNPRGISRGAIRLVAQVQKGLTIKDGSLKQGLRLLGKAKEIENRDRLWFPTKHGGQHG